MRNEITENHVMYCAVVTDQREGLCTFVLLQGREHSCKDAVSTARPWPFAASDLSPHRYKQSVRSH